MPKSIADNYFNYVYKKVDGKSVQDLERLTTYMNKKLVEAGLNKSLNIFKMRHQGNNYLLLKLIDSTSKPVTEKAGVFLANGELKALGAKPVEQPFTHVTFLNDILGIESVSDNTVHATKQNQGDDTKASVNTEDIKTLGKVKYKVVSTKSRQTGVSMLDYYNFVIKVVNDATKQDVLDAFDEPMVDVSSLGNDTYSITRYLD